MNERSWFINSSSNYFLFQPILFSNNLIYNIYYNSVQHKSFARSYDSLRILCTYIVCVCIDRFSGWYFRVWNPWSQCRIVCLINNHTFIICVIIFALTKYHYFNSTIIHVFVNVKFWDKILLLKNLNFYEFVEIFMNLTEKLFDCLL